ncbi:beta-propeller uncharacterized protein DUF5122 [Sphingobacterium sp. JUb20]|nr:beta-propeller uncharacterized protein DUF5122 [Sphingobacterium sp. JUb20]
MKLTTKLFVIFVLSSVMSCSNKIEYGPDPYAGGKEPLDVVFQEGTPSPSQAKVGSTVVFKVNGLLKYKDQIKFYINNVESDIVDITDSTLTSVVSENTSTGGVKAVVNGQVFAGPNLPIIGKLGIDLTFQSGVGSNGPLFSIAKFSNNQIFIGGMFSDYNGNGASSKISGLARITNAGEFVRGMKFGQGVTGNVNSMNELNDGNILISGGFQRYDTVSMIKNMTTISSVGALLVKSTPILNLTDDPNKSNIIVPAFNGGSETSILKTFVQNNKVTIVGGFKTYSSNYYVRSTYDNILTDFFGMNGVVRMNMDGSLDSTYFVDHKSIPKRSYTGVNGSIFDAHLQSDGKLVLVGIFSTFNGSNAANGIVRLNDDGTFDPSFQTGSGANGMVFDISYVKETKKYVLTGSFTSFNGIPANGIVVINLDGSVDKSFQSKGFTGGTPSYAVQLSNGLIVVTGTFKTYDSIIREGLLVLNADGTLAQDYNNTGRLVGTVNDSLEGTNSLGQRTLTLVGGFTSFNGKSNLGNIVRLTILD